MNSLRRVMICMRCGEAKELHWFPVKNKAWFVWCNRCIRTPSGVMPYRQGEQDRRASE